MKKVSVDNNVTLQSLLASIVVHSEEMFSNDSHLFDRVALKVAIEHPYVQAWIMSLGALAPVKRIADALSREEETEK